MSRGHACQVIGACGRPVCGRTVNAGYCLGRMEILLQVCRNERGKERSLSESILRAQVMKRHVLEVDDTSMGTLKGAGKPSILAWPWTKYLKLMILSS